jgi:dTDP-4-amino-4,6-dideoxygalactose transaminase
VRDFEARWREFTGLKHAITTVNGTTALYSAMFALGVGPGDEVISPAFNWICSIAPAPLLGAAPVFCDSDPATMLLDPADLRRKITKKTRAIIAVHLWGWVCDMDAIMAISRETGVPVIEDCSHAHGARYRGMPVGRFGQVACWSLQGSKPVSAGEGGIIATNDTAIYERACLIGQVNRIAGMDLATPTYEKYQPLGTGMKFRAHPLGIGIASVQLGKLAALNDGRRRWVEAIEAGIADIPFLRPTTTYPGAERAGFYGFPVHFLQEQAGSLTPAAFVEALNAQGVKAGLNPYPLLHLLPYFSEGFDLHGGHRGPLDPAQGWQRYRPGSLSQVERMAAHLVFLPVLTDPVEGAADWVLERIHRVAGIAST